MLDFTNKVYEKILNLGIKHNVLANCREYPSLLFNKQRFNLNKVQINFQEKFNNPKFVAGLYVHFPFCQSRCTFCKYYSEIVSDEDIFSKYLRVLERELELYQVDFSKIELDNLCLGGGTPTLLNEQQIEKYMDIIYRFFRFKSGAQISIEGTPETITLTKVREYKRLGINRISLGLQSLNNKVLKKIGRRHTVKDVSRAFDIIRKSEIKYIATDIIWGLPNESLVTYKKTINNLIKLSPEFVEGFLLTTGGRVKINRFYPPEIKIDKVINLYKEQFLSNGYRINSSGNFLGVIKKDIHQSKAVNQNMDGLYNCRSSVLGIGTGASSHFNNLKYKIVSDFKTYSTFLLNNIFPPLYGTKINKDNHKRQYIISRIGFFRSINKDNYYKLFKRDLTEDFPKEIAYLKDKGIIHETKNQYKWLLDEQEMGHQSFFRHVIKYWYSSKYIRQIIKEYF